jgi:leucyl-tRNA synthetase
MLVPREIAREELEKLALGNARVIEFTKGLTIRKVVVVPGKLVNIVAN